MAKKNPGDVLTCDWNPVIGCEKYSEGCRACWYLNAIFPWQQRLGNIPLNVNGNEHYLFENRMTVESLKAKSGIVGIVQHGDLFWDGVPDEVIERVLSVIEATARVKREIPKYVLWTKRAQRMANILRNRYPSGLPNYLAAAVTVENQERADERLPFLLSIRGTRIIVLEPLLGPVTLAKYLPVDWVIVGSETGDQARPIHLSWVESIRDEVKAHDIPFFVKQLSPTHTNPIRVLTGREWNEFPQGFRK